MAELYSSTHCSINKHNKHSMHEITKCLDKWSDTISQQELPLIKIYNSISI